MERIHRTGGRQTNSASPPDNAILLPIRGFKKGLSAPQTRTASILILLLRGVLYGLGASALAALYAHFVSQRGWNGTAAALNGTGTILWCLGAAFGWGAFGTHGQEMGKRARVGQATAPLALPFKDMLLALIAGSVCFGLIWAGNVLAASGG
ncbi:hypothetical protein [Deinococcus humi]|uniref:Uncharacterized protein n=1 Tax=Deinococcus humi TaxID=662880 RepID=A0A7W8NFS6_9DEIO|nr:hypothetical protein [Deinococcus humi]MBB5364741.1 hypothetical protein [Deinococcus humi]